MILQIIMTSNLPITFLSSFILLNRICWSQWKTLFFFTKFQFQWKLNAKESDELEEFLEVHLEDNEDLFPSSNNYQKLTQCPWKPYTQCYKLIQCLNHKWGKIISWTSGVYRNQLKRMFKGILFSTICDVTIESTCNIEYEVFKGPEFISDNY